MERPKSIKSDVNCYEMKRTTNSTKNFHHDDLNTRLSKRSSLFGKSLVFLTVISFLFIGLIINCLQLIILCSSKLSEHRRWKSFHKNLNGHLMYIFFSPCIFLAYYWSNIKLNIKLDDINLIEEARRPFFGLMIPNHSYEIDYMVCFVLADQLDGLGCFKSLSKYELKFLPIIGWSLWMGDIIFVRRDWKKDRLSLGKKLSQLLHYDRCLVGLFAEGTRFTKEKHQVSKAYAHSKGIEPLKYHLQPRTRGFNYTVRYYLKELNDTKIKDPESFRIFNMQIVMPPNIKFSDFVNGVQLSADVYCEEVKISDNLRLEVINSKDEEDCPGLNKLLLDIFRRKDEIVQEYKDSGNKFVIRDLKKGGQYPFKRKKGVLIVWLLGFVLTYATFGYLALVVYAKSLTFWTLIISFVSACFYMLRRIEKESQTKSLSSICSKEENNFKAIDNNCDQSILITEKQKETSKKDIMDDRDEEGQIIGNMSPC